MSDVPPFIRRMAYSKPQFKQSSRLRRWVRRNYYEFICYIITALGLTIVLQPKIVAEDSTRAVTWMFVTVVCLLVARVVSPWLVKR